MCDGTRGLGDHLDRFFKVSCLDHSESGDREWRRHESRIFGPHALVLWITDLDRRTGSSDQGPGLHQVRIMRIGSVPDFPPGPIITIFVAVSDGYELRHRNSPE